MVKNTIKCVVVVVTVLCLGACASFQNEEVTRIKDLPDVSNYQNKPKVYIDLKFFSGDPSKGKATENPAARDIVQPAIEEMFEDKQVFAEYTFDQFEQSDMDYVLKLHFYNHGNSGAAAISGLLCGFTFGVIPAAATDNYTLKSELVQNDSLLTTVDNKDSVTTWLGIWFIPMMGKTPQIAVQETTANQVKAAIVEMIENGKLKYSLQDYLLNTAFL